MEFWFYGIPLLMAALLSAMAVVTVYRAWALQRLWRSGETAQGRCVHTYTTTRGGGSDRPVRTSLHHVYEYRTASGRQVRFEEVDGSATTIPGDAVTVRYDAARPERATARQPDIAGNVLRTAAAAAVCVGAVVVCCLFVTSAASPPSPTDPTGGYEDPWSVEP